ncbi:uncharacterized protein LOC120943022 [Rana temporaria]|uniref:uncharacterized protein LOC120943022 n=1 Tax=Rana temporaria TaxID=8407 RepID=UPI001AAD0ABB|nr:uncharacterized protein LOC120943022 [Rana temporaria]
MDKQEIIAKHLKRLTESGWRDFKMALCKKKPSGGVEGPKMRNLNNKTVEDIVESIFRWYTERLGPGTIMGILKALKENEIRTSIQRELKKASEARKGMQAPRAVSKGVTPNDNSVSSSGIPVKKFIRRDGDVPTQSHNTGQNVNTKRGPRPIQTQRSQGVSPRIQQSVNRKEGPRPAQKQQNPAMADFTKHLDLKVFISEVRALPCLYDVKHPCSNDMVKKTLWKDIASKAIKNWEQLDSKEKEERINFMPQKWERFVNSFHNENKQQVSENGSGSTSSTRQKYHHYEQLKFLLPTIDQRQTSSSFAINGEQNDVQQDHENVKEQRIAANKINLHKQASKRVRYMQVPSMGSKDATPNDDTVSSSEPPAKKIRQEDRVVAGPSHKTKQNVHKMGRPSPAQEEPKQGIANKIQQNVEKKGEPKPAQIKAKQEIADLSELSQNPVKFFREVQARSAIYDRKHPHHRNKQVKKKLWEEVASKVIKDWEQLDPKDKEVTVSLVCKKWRNFADSFRREYNKQTSKSTRDSLPSKNTKYRYYEQLKFLQCTLDQRQTSSNLDGEQDDMQQVYENDDCREKKNQAAANKTKKSEQVLQTVTEGYSQGPSQSEQSLPNIRMEKEINNIVTRHLKTLRGDDIASFKHILCAIDPPLKEGRIVTSEVKDKSVEDMVDLIIHHHTAKHVEETLTKILALMKKHNMKMLIERDFTQLNQQRNEKRKVGVF